MTRDAVAVYCFCYLLSACTLVSNFDYREAPTEMNDSSVAADSDVADTGADDDAEVDANPPPVDADLDATDAPEDADPPDTMDVEVPPDSPPDAPPMYGPTTGGDSGSGVNDAGPVDAGDAQVPPHDAASDARPSVDGCTPESDGRFCARLFASCGSVVALDNCKTERSVNCGSCVGGECTGNTCFCTAESNATFCTRLKKSCGPASGMDNCGTQRNSVECGSCASGQCSTNNECCAVNAQQYRTCPGVEVVAENQGQPRGIAADDGAIYWTNEGDGTVLRADPNSLTRQTLAFGQGQPAAIDLSATHVYWTAADIIDPAARVEGPRIGVRRILKTGAGMAVVAAVSPHSLFTGVSVDLVVTPERLYWVQRINSATLSLVSARNGPGVYLGVAFDGEGYSYYEPPMPYQSLATDGSSIFWVAGVDAFTGGCAVFRADLDGTNQLKIFSSSLSVGSLSVLPGSVYVTNALQDATFGAPWAIKQVPSAGGAPVTVELQWPGDSVMRRSGAMLVMVDSSTAIVGSSGDRIDYTIASFTLATREARHIATTGAAPGDLAVTASHVYWTEPNTGRVLRAAR